MTSATLSPITEPTSLDDDFAPLDVRVVVAAHPHGKLMCSTGDGCGSTCSNGASACNSFVEDPA
ncbi:FxLD family lantipeptide [Actinacidiphila yanglinensis]|uniref:FxLD family lantipeptide n=1 Tax=Actinacidiphila yanglinensis TaxID=310779 RepID=A0A1H6DKB8_9ACTN|nr:FxLD family lanthipeptide [Actinacidiphila yanglinensis]SEG85770.1 FxLD family lantipeptide [Actinacidiphila yanglinensis]